MSGSSPAHPAPRWALVLAGGSGHRLRPLTRRIAGDDRPKQFCALLGPETLWEATRRRARLVVAPGRILSVVTRAHRRFYAARAADGGIPSLVVQPEDRGTAPAILYGCLRISRERPLDAVAVLPCDHWVSDEAAFMRHVAAAFDAVETRPDLVVLLGVPPDGPETEYGWIEPGDPLPGTPLRRVRSFREKPAADLARALLAGGAYWNSFVMVARVAVLLGLIRHAAPALYAALAAIAPALGTPWEPAAVGAVYATLSPLSFSHRILAASPRNLAVLPVTGVRWCDLGSPRRVYQVLAETGLRPAWLAPSPGPRLGVPSAGPHPRRPGSAAADRAEPAQGATRARAGVEIDPVGRAHLHPGAQAAPGTRDEP